MLGTTRTIALAAASLLALTAGTAFAQDAEPAVPQAAASDDGITEIVVTARKREESLQNVPASVLAIGEAQIDNLNAKTIQDLNGVTPNMRIAADGTLAIRGIASNARNSGFEAGAAVYIDGVYQGRPVGNNQDLVDIERVEVLRGPQGTLYGKNTTAGAISIITARPGNTWTGKGEIQYAEQDDIRVSGYVAGPVIADTLGIKVAGFRRRSDGYQINLATGDRHGKQDVWGGRGEIRLTTGPLDLSLRGDIVRDNGTPAAQEPVASFAAASSPGIDTISYNRGYYLQRRGGGASLTSDIDLGNDYTLTSVTAWRTFRAGLTLDDDWSPVDMVYHVFEDRYRQWTQEVRLTSPSTGPFSWILGGYYFHQQLNSNRPVFLTGAFPVHGVLDDTVEVKTDAFAAFANADYHITGKLTVNAGLRFTSERKTLDFDQQGVAALGYPDLLIKDRFTDSDLSPTVALSYEFSNAATAYVKFARGFKSGGWNPDITTTTRIGFDAENVTNYEAGLRTRLLDGKLGINLTGYYMDYDNLQVSQFLGTFAGYVVTNAGKARVKGIEAEVQARPAQWLTLAGGAAFNQARYVDFDSGTGTNYKGQQFTNAPKFSGFASLDVSAPVTAALTFKAHGDVRYQSKIFFDDARRSTPGIGAFAQDGYALVNLRAGVALDNGVEVMAFVDNLTNNRALANRNTDALSLGITLDTYIPPRQFGGRLSFRF